MAEQLNWPHPMVTVAIRNYLFTDWHIHHDEWPAIGSHVSIGVK